MCAWDPDVRIWYYSSVNWLQLGLVPTLVITLVHRIVFFLLPEWF